MREADPRALELEHGRLHGLLESRRRPLAVPVRGSQDLDGWRGVGGRREQHLLRLRPQSGDAPADQPSQIAGNGQRHARRESRSRSGQLSSHLEREEWIAAADLV